MGFVVEAHFLFSYFDWTKDKMIRKASLLSLVAMLFSSIVFGQKLFKQLLPKETGINFKNEIIETEELNVLSYEYFYNGGGVASCWL